MKKNVIFTLLTAAMLSLSSNAATHDRFVTLADNDIMLVQSQQEQNITTEQDKVTEDVTNASATVKEATPAQKSKAPMKTKKAKRNNADASSPSTTIIAGHDSTSNDTAVNLQDNNAEFENACDRMDQHYQNPGLDFMDRLFHNNNFWVTILVLISLSMFFILALVFIISRSLGRRYTNESRNAYVESHQHVSEKINITSQDPNSSNIYERDEQWKKGIKHISLGIGFALLVCTIGAKELSGIGMLITCLGLGQVIISRRYSIEDYKNLFHSKKHNKKDNTDNGDTPDAASDVTPGNTTKPEPSADNSTETAEGTTNTSKTSDENTAGNSDEGTHMSELNKEENKDITE